MNTRALGDRHHMPSSRPSPRWSPEYSIPTQIQLMRKPHRSSAKLVILPKYILTNALNAESWINKPPWRNRKQLRRPSSVVTLHLARDMSSSVYIEVEALFALVSERG